MLRLTYWAQARPKPARLLLILLHVLLVMVAIRLGLALDLAGVEVPTYGPVIAAVVTAFGFLLYPYGKPLTLSTWRHRKFTEGTILTGSVVAIALIAALIVSTPVPGTGTAPRADTPAQFTSLTHPEATLDKPMAKQQRRDQRRWRRAMRAKVKHYLRTEQRKIDKWGAAALIFLTVLLAGFLQLLVLALSCSISCNGAEGLAVVVAVLGTAGVILLAVVAVGATLRAKRRSENPDNPRYRRAPRKKILE